MPPPTGVVSGPLMPDDVLREGGDGLVGQPRAGLVERLLPGQDLHPLDALPPPRATAASRTSWVAGQMSTPVPSPRMNGMIGSSGTTRVPSAATVMRSGIGARA